MPTLLAGPVLSGSFGSKTRYLKQRPNLLENIRQIIYSSEKKTKFFNETTFRF